MADNFNKEKFQNSSRNTFVPLVNEQILKTTNFIVLRMTLIRGRQPAFRSR